MITLDICDYCHNCEDFEAALDKREYETYADNEGTSYHTDITVHCRYRNRCANLFRYLKKEIKKDGTAPQRT